MFGQAGHFDTASANPVRVTSTSFRHPMGLAFDPQGGLWVTDFYNMRALEVATRGSSPDTPAAQVLGQDGQLTTDGCHVSADGLCGPTGIAFDAVGHAFVADGFNNRILAYFSPSISLARVDHFRVIRHGTTALIRWHSVGPIRGFALYMGYRRLTGHLLHPDRLGDSHQDVPWTGKGPLALHVVLQTGTEVTILTS